MSSIADIRAKMNSKYGDPEEDKKQQEQKRQNNTASATATSNVEKIRTKMDSKYNPTYSHVDQSFINTFFTDAQNFLNSAKGRYGGMNSFNKDSVYDSIKNERNDLRSRSWDIRQYLGKNKGAMNEDDYISLLTLLDDFDKASISTDYGFYKAKEYGFADNYAKYTNMSSDEIKNHIMSQEDKDIIHELMLSNMPYNREYAEQDGRDMAIYDDVEKKRKYISKKYGIRFTESSYENAQLLTELINENPVAFTTDSGQNITWERLYNNALAAEDLASRYETYSQNADWAEKSQAIDVVADTESDYQIISDLARTLVPHDWESAEAYGVERATFDDIEKKRKYISEKYGVDLYSDIYNNINIYNSLMEELEGQEGETGNFKNMSYLTYDEKAVLSYIYQTEGRAAALAWHNSRMGIYQERSNNYLARGMTDVGEDYPFWGSVGAVALRLGSGVEYLTDIFDLMATGEYQSNTLALASSSITSGVTESINWEIGNWDAFDFIYNAGMSMAESVASTALMGNLGGITLGLSAAAQATNDALNRGMSQGQAFWNGLISGVFEGLFESWSIGNFSAFKDVASAHGKDIALNIAKSMLVNASEETLTEIANIAYDSIFNGDFSQYETLVRQYVVSGMNESEAKQKAALDLGKQVVESGASGAFMGLGFGGIGSSQAIANNMINANKTAAQTYNIGKDIINTDGGIDTLKAMTANVSGADSKLAKQADKLTSERSTGNGVGKVVAGVKNMGQNWSAGKVYRAVESTAAAQHKTELASALMDSGFSEKIAKNIADAVVANLNGDILTNSQKSTLESVKDNRIVGETIKNVLNKITVDEYSRLVEASQQPQETAAATGSEVVTDVPKSAQAVQTGSVEAPTATGKESLQVAEESTVADKTHQISSGKEIIPQKVISISNGKAIIQTDNGKISAEDIAFGNEDMDLLWRSAVQFNGINPAGANGVIRAYQSSIPVATYITGAAQEFKNGYHNFPSGGQYADKLTPYQRTIIYELGQKAAGENTAKDQAKVKKETVSKKEKVAKKQGKVYFDKGAKQITDFRSYAKKTGLKLEAVQETAIQTMEKLSAALGIDFYVFQSYEKNGKRVYLDENGVEISAPSGKYYSDGRIYIDLYAGNTGKGTMLYTVAHELTHYIRQWSPAKFKVLANFLMKQYGKNGKSVRELVDNQIAKAKRNGKDISFDEAYEEVVADSMETMLNDGNVVQMMADLRMQDQTLWQKICDWFKNLAKDLKAVVDAYKGHKPDSAEGKMVADMQDVIVILESLYADALVDASENYLANKAQKNTAQEDGINGEYDIKLMARDEEAFKPFVNKINSVINQAIVGKGNIEGKVQVMDIMPVGPKLAAMVSASSDGAMDMSQRSIALNTGDVWHEFKRHTSVNDEVSRGQIAFTKRQFCNAIKCVISPDIVETVFQSTANPTQKQSFAYAKRTSRGHYVVVEAVGGNKNPHIYPVMILQFSKDKWKKMMSEGKTLGEILFENDPKKLQSLNIEQNKKSRVTAAQFASYEAIANTLRSPQLDAKVPQFEEKVKEKFALRDSATAAKISESLTMQEAKQMIQRAFVLGNIKEWYDDEYKNGDEWLAGAGVEEVAMYIENEYTLQAAYLDKIQGLLDEEFYLTDILEAYQEGTLTGKVKKQSERINIADSVAVADPRFYAPKEIANAKELFGIANQKITNANREAVNHARSQILLYAHNKGAAETLGITPSELNKKLRTWGGYSAKARDISLRINAGAHATNRWTGIESLSWLNKATVTDEDVVRMVKAVEGNGDRFQNNYIARTMLALDTHIDWSWLTIKFDTVAGVNKSSHFGSRCNGYYRNDSRLIHVKYDAPNTVAHEMGHALDYQWGRDIGYAYTAMTEISRNTDKLSGDVLTWFNNFKDFTDSLVASSDIRNEYSMDIKETFARFVAKFVEWTEQLATGRSSSYETSYYNDKFTATQFIQFARLLQEKSAIDAKGLTQNKLEAQGEASGTVRLQDRDPEAMRVNKLLENENAKLKEDVSYLKEMLKLQRQVTGGTKFTKTSVEAAAKMLMKNANAKGDKVEITRLLNDLYEYISTSDDLTWEGVVEQAQPAVEWLQKHYAVKNQTSSYAQDILRELRGSRIYLDEHQKKEAAYAYGSFGEFRNKTMGSIIITDKGSVSLDSKWAELSGSYPNIFHPGTTSTDMPSALLDAIGTLRNMTDMDAYGYNEELAAQDLLHQVYDSYWNVSTLHTVADVKQKEINRLKSQHIDRMAKLKEYHKEQTAQLKADHKADLERVRKEYRNKAEVKQKEIIEKYQASKKKAIETRDKREAREKLQKLVLDTVKWITYPSKTDVKCPDILKQPYADFLNSIDLSSQRLAKGGDPTKNDLRMTNAMSSLATALERVLDSQNPSIDHNNVDSAVLDAGYLDLPVDFVKVLRKMTEDIQKMMGNNEYVVNRMPAEEVRKLTQMIRTLNHAIKEVSTLYANLRFANVEALGEDTMSFIDALGEIEKTGGIKDFVQWDNALPYYAFKRFGKGGESIFEGLMDAQDKLAYLAQQIFDFREKAWTDKEAKAWSEDTHTIDLPNGSTLTLTTADAMSIYCLSRREHALPHLLGGGVRVIGIQKGSQKAKDSYSLLTVKDIDTIISSLTDRQIKVAEAIQEFMSSVCSDWGNEISMKRFLTKEFNEKFYFPIESNDENLPEKDPSAQQSDLYRLLNISATKPIDPRANNEVIIRNVFDVFTNHAADMARLNAYGMALLDYMKWLNYREKTVNEEGQINVRGVRKSLKKAFGDAAWSYIRNLIKDVNGRPSDNGDPTMLMKWMRNAKIASVGANLRVAVLQLTAYPRAAMVLSTKSISLGLTKVPQINKAKKYCGIALWKSFGFYDTNIARSIEDQMRGATNIRQKIIELSMKGAEIGDAITWGALWNACEYEVAATKKYKVGTEEFYQEVGKKLREVVYATQVVDSTLTRSSLMRSKSGTAQEAASFMSEPTTTSNILMNAGFQFVAEKRRTGSIKAAWHKTSKLIGRAIAVHFSVAVLAALVESLGDAWRDDDDEERYTKFFKALPQNVLLNILPFNKVPILSDVVDLVLSRFGIGFFSSEKLSTQWLSLAASAADAWGDVLSGNSSVTPYNAMYKTVRAISSGIGLPIGNAMREGVALWNNTAGAYDITWKIRTWDLSKTDLASEALDAIIAGNDRQANSIRAEFTDDDSYQSAMRTAIKDRYTAGEIDYDTAMQYLIKYGGMEEDDAYWKAEEWMYESETGDDFGKYDEFFTAVETGKNLKAVIKKYTDNGVELETLSSQISTHYKPLYIGMSKSEKAGIKGYLLNAITLCGYTREEAEERIAKWEFESDHPELIDRITFTQYKRWETDGKPNGVSIELFLDVAEFRDDGTSNSVKSQDEVKQYIMSVASDTRTRRALWCCFYKASTSPW